MKWRWWWESLDTAERAAAIGFALVALWIIVNIATGGPS